LASRLAVKIGDIFPGYGIINFGDFGIGIVYDSAMLGAEFNNCVCTAWISIFKWLLRVEERRFIYRKPICAKV